MPPSHSVVVRSPTTLPVPLSPDNAPPCSHTTVPQPASHTPLQATKHDYSHVPSLVQDAEAQLPSHQPAIHSNGMSQLAVALMAPPAVHSPRISKHEYRYAVSLQNHSLHAI